MTCASPPSWGRWWAATVESHRIARHPRRQRQASAPTAPFLDLRPGASGGDDRRQREGHALRSARSAAPLARERAPRTSSRSPRRPGAAASVRGSLLRVQVRAGRLHRALDHELREQGIRCTNVCPGGVATDFAMEEGRGRRPDMPELDGMMQAEDVAGRGGLRARASADAPDARDRIPADDRRRVGMIQIGLLSTADIHRAHLAAAAETSSIVAVASRSRAKAEAVAREWGSSACTTPTTSCSSNRGSTPS